MLYSSYILCHIHHSFCAIFIIHFVLYSSLILCYIRHKFCAIFIRYFVLYSSFILCYIHNSFCVIFIIQFVLYSSYILCYTHHSFCSISIINFVLYPSFILYYIHHILCAIFIIYSVESLTNGPYPLPVPHMVRSSTSSFHFHYPFLPLRSSSSCFRLHPHLPLISILPSNFPWIKCFRRQFPRKMWPIQLPFLLFTVSRIFLSTLTLTLLHFSHYRSSWFTPSFSINTFKKLQVIFDLFSEVMLGYSETKLIY